MCLKKKTLNSEQLLQITHSWLYGSIPGGKARTSEGWILACPMCLFMVQHIIKQHFTGSKLANWKALKRNNELRGSWHAIKKFVIGFGKSDGSLRERDHFWAIALRIFLSSRADIYEKGELFLSQIQVLTLVCSKEAALHCRPEVLELSMMSPFSTDLPTTAQRHTISSVTSSLNSPTCGLQFQPKQSRQEISQPLNCSRCSRLSEMGRSGWDACIRNEKMNRKERQQDSGIWGCLVREAFSIPISD